MNTQNQNGIVVDSFGNVDIAYYEAKAQQMRIESIAKGFAAASAYVERTAVKLGRTIKSAFKGYTSSEA